MIFQKKENKCPSFLPWASSHGLTRNLNTPASQHHDMKAMKCVYCPPLRLFCKTISHSELSLLLTSLPLFPHFCPLLQRPWPGFASGVHHLLRLPELRWLQELQSEQEQPIWVLRSSVRTWKSIELPIGGRALCSPERSAYKWPDLSLCTRETRLQRGFKSFNPVGARMLKRTRACWLHLMCLPERCCDSLKVTSM